MCEERVNNASFSSTSRYYVGYIIYMKKLLFFITLVSISFSLFAQSSGLPEARELAEK